MRTSLLSQAVSGAALVAGMAVSPRGFEKGDNLAPLLPISGMNHKLVPLADAIELFADVPKAKTDPATYNDTAPSSEQLNKSFGTLESSSAAASCTNPAVRYEWDDYSTSDRQALMAAFKCLMNKPASGKFSVSTSRWEDFARLHQMYTPNIHQNQKFLPWHRYFVYVFEQALRNECGFDRAFFWFDETKHAGAFSSSGVFDSAYLGTLGSTSHCVTDGAFAGLTAHIGPGTGNSAHCLSRQGNAADTAQCSTAYINQCMGNNLYSDFEKCLEYGPHGYGHNGVGGVMADVYASPGEPFFWFHHTFVDHAYRVWQLADPSTRYTTIDGTDINGNALSLDTVLYFGGLAPDVTIREVINTLSGDALCYRYNY